MTTIDAQPWTSAEIDRPDAVEKGLFLLFLIGLYLGVSLKLPGGVPVPAVLAGAAGLLLALKQAPRIPTAHAAAGLAILALAALSTLAAGDFALLMERFKGFVQLSYSLIVGYAVFLTGQRLDRRTLAALFLALSLTILLGALAETVVPAIQNASDSFRSLAFDSGIYAADARDLALYGRIRPKFFTSEPSLVAFGYALFVFCWYVLARMPGKLLAYLGLLAAGYAVIRGPAIVLAVALVPVYETLLGARRATSGRSRLDGPLALLVATGTGVLALVGTVVGWEVLSQRIDGIAAGRDPSFFARIVAPAIVAGQTLQAHPVAGVGLTGWEALRDQVTQLYATTDWLALDMQFDGPAHALTNYFWALWIFLGLGFGTAMVAALTWLLRQLGVPSLLFCWTVWIVFGQTVGGFVGPRTWAVFFLTALVAVQFERGRRERDSHPAAAVIAPGAPYGDPRLGPPPGRHAEPRLVTR